MCIFSQPVESVDTTKIFARYKGGYQWLAYQMNYSSNVELAMILPIPGDSVEFISLEKYPSFFGILGSFFPEPISKGMAKGASRGFDPIKVEKVGSFSASFVPSVKDFDRLDPQFVISRHLWDQIPAYSNYGFVVFALDKNATTVHPMAFKFRSRLNGCFFPTKHIHDGQIHQYEGFDHKLFFQSPFSANCRKNKYNGGDFDGMLSHGQDLYYFPANGFLKNKDVFIDSKPNWIN